MSKKFMSLLLLGYLVVGLASPLVVLAQEAPAVRQADPGGGSTGNASDVPAATPGVPNMPSLLD